MRSARRPIDGDAAAALACASATPPRFRRSQHTAAALSASAAKSDIANSPLSHVLTLSGSFLALALLRRLTVALSNKRTKIAFARYDHMTAAMFALVCAA